MFTCSIYEISSWPGQYNCMIRPTNGSVTYRMYLHYVAGFLCTYAHSTPHRSVDRMSTFRYKRSFNLAFNQGWLWLRGGNTQLFPHAASVVFFKLKLALFHRSQYFSPRLHGLDGHGSPARVPLGSGQGARCDSVRRQRGIRDVSQQR